MVLPIQRPSALPRASAPVAREANRRTDAAHSARHVPPQPVVQGPVVGSRDAVALHLQHQEHLAGGRAKELESVFHVIGRSAKVCDVVAFYNESERVAHPKRSTTEDANWALTKTIDTREVKPYTGCCFKCLLPQRESKLWHDYDAPPEAGRQATAAPCRNCYYPHVLRPLLAAIWAGKSDSGRKRLHTQLQGVARDVPTDDSFVAFMRWAGTKALGSVPMNNGMCVAWQWAASCGVLQTHFPVE